MTLGQLVRLAAERNSDEEMMSAIGKQDPS